MTNLSLGSGSSIIENSQNLMRFQVRFDIESESQGSMTSDQCFHAISGRRTPLGVVNQIGFNPKGRIED